MCSHSTYSSYSSAECHHLSPASGVWLKQCTDISKCILYFQSSQTYISTHFVVQCNSFMSTYHSSIRQYAEDRETVYSLTPGSQMEVGGELGSLVGKGKLESGRRSQRFDFSSVTFLSVNHFHITCHLCVNSHFCVSGLFSFSFFSNHQLSNHQSLSINL